MEVQRLLVTLMHGNQLKRTPRTGWSQRGVASGENVAAHSYGVVFTALILAELIDPPPDMAVVLAMATLHDLPEALTTDIPAPAWRLFPAGAKAAAEREAIEEILAGTPFAPHLLNLWEELRQNRTAEARLVHDADKLDQFLQAYVYELQTGNRQLDEFWRKPHAFHFPQANAVYEELCRRRADSIGGSLPGVTSPHIPR